MLPELEGVRARLKKEKDITNEQLWRLESLYILLGLHEDDFCKIIDAAGLDVFLARHSRYDRLIKVFDEAVLRECCHNAKLRLKALEAENLDLQRIGDLRHVIDSCGKLWQKDCCRDRAGARCPCARGIQCPAGQQSGGRAPLC